MKSTNDPKLVGSTIAGHHAETATRTDSPQASVTFRHSRWRRLGFAMLAVVGATAVWIALGAKMPTAVTGNNVDQSPRNPAAASQTSGGAPAGNSAVDVTQHASTSPNADPLPVRTTNLTAAAFYEIIRTFTGEIRAARSSDVGFDLAGTVIDLLVDEGDRVDKQQLLALIDTDRLKAERDRIDALAMEADARLQELLEGPRQESIGAAHARVKEVEADLELLIRKQAKRDRLLETGAATQEEKDDADTAVASARARLERVRNEWRELVNGTRQEQIAAQRAVVERLGAEKAQLDVELEKSRLHAPYAGTVAARLLDEGEVVRAGEPVFRLVEDHALEAVVGVGPHMAAALSKGDACELTYQGHAIGASVKSLLPEIDSVTRTRSIVLTLSESAVPYVQPGAIVELAGRRRIPADGYWVPTESLVRAERGLWAVYVIHEEAGRHTVHRNAVDVLYTEATRSFIRASLDETDLIIAEGVHRVTPGQVVEPLEGKRRQERTGTALDPNTISREPEKE